jgi:hypothetical protein
MGILCLLVVAGVVASAWVKPRDTSPPDDARRADENQENRVFDVDEERLRRRY